MFSHLLLTRMNVEVRFAPSGRGLQADWLRHRLDLFRRVCLPSVEGQTASGFRWLVFFSEASPPWFLSELRTHLSTLRRDIPTTVIPCTAFGPAEVRAAIRTFVRTPDSHVLTTRLDNDDALARDAVARLQTSFDPSFTGYLNFPVGLVLCRDRVYRATDLSNAFCSFSAPASEEHGPFSVPHTDMASSRFPVRQLDSSPGWLVHVHEKNAAHRPFGIRTHKRVLKNGFTHLYDGGVENGLAVLGERGLCSFRQSAGIVLEYVRQRLHPLR